MPGVMQRNGDIHSDWHNRNGNGRSNDRRGDRDMYPSSRDDLYSRPNKQNGGPPMQNSRGGPSYNDEYYSDQQSTGSREDRDSGPLYELDHLATFKVGQRQGVMFPEDGMTKLRQMETSTGVWTMRCQMLIERKYILIKDKQTGEEMERFPMHLINDPTAYMNRDRKDLYNNVLLFTVNEDPKKRHSAPSEMHIFQSISGPSSDIVDDIKTVKSDKPQGRQPYAPLIRHAWPTPPGSSTLDSRQTRHDDYNDRIPPPPTNPAPEPPGGRPHVRDAVSRLEQMQTDQDDYGDRPLSRFRESYRRGPEDDRESTTSERTDRDVQLLNHCFDDIERFVARLQMAAESFKELEDRRRFGKNKKKKERGHGEGMLTMRARPPPAQDFISVFQKFKFSFNLLAKLKAHIHNPNAPELVHFLFTPLSLIIEASKDPRHGTPDLAAKVISPLMTNDARDLLAHCLSSKEADLWVTLGDAWTISSDTWKGYVPPYIPRFDDGWQPAPHMFDDGTTQALANAAAHHAQQIRHQEDNYRAREEARDHVYPVEHNSRPPYGETVYRDQQRREEMSQGYDEYDRPPDRVPPQVHQQDPRNRQAHEREWERDRVRDRGDYDRRERDREPMPEPPVVTSFEEEQKYFAQDMLASSAKLFEVSHARESKNDKELGVVKGEFVEVLDSSRNWWKLRNAQGQVGHAPYTILKEFKVEEHPEMMDNGRSDPRDGGYRDGGYRDGGYHDGGHRDSGHRDSGQYSSYIPPPPPPSGPPPPPQVARKPTRRDSDSVDDRPRSRLSSGDLYSKQMSNPIDDVNSELKQRWSRMPNRPKSAIQTYMSLSSGPVDVKEWLYSKGFTDRVVYAFDGYSGKDMFNLARHQLEERCGHEEGMRLDSQLTVQKNIAGYSNTQGRNSELNAILQRRKQRADSNDNEEQENNRSLGRPPSYAPSSPPDSDGSSDYADIDGGNTLRAQLRRQKKLMHKKY